MKRLVAVLLCMTMAVSITACGNSETENNKVAGTEAGDKPEINRKALALFVQPTKKDFMSMLERSTKKCMV